MLEYYKQVATLHQGWGLLLKPYILGGHNNEPPFSVTTTPKLRVINFSATRTNQHTFRHISPPSDHLLCYLNSYCVATLDGATITNDE